MSLNYITKKEFLKEFKIDRHTFAKWVSERGLPIKKIGYKTYLSKDELDGWLKDFSVNHPHSIEWKSVFNEER